MKEVLELIEQKKQEFAKLPFFEFLQDESIDPRQRLVWAPCLAPFVMMFKDFNAYVIRKEPADNKLQEMINKHSYEDGRHWRWYLEDIEKLSLNESLKFTDSLRFLWGEETKRTRQISYKLFGLCSFEEDLVIKLAVIESIEATGNIALALLGKVGHEFHQNTQKKLHYFSESHFNVETGHIQAGLSHDEAEILLKNIDITQEQKNRAFEAVETVFDGFSESLNEMMECISRNSSKRRLEENLAYNNVC